MFPAISPSFGQSAFGKPFVSSAVATGDESMVKNGEWLQEIELGF